MSGLAGRRPFPARLNLLRGNPGKRPPRPEPALPPLAADAPPPSWLKGRVARRTWRELLAVLAPAGLVAVSDVMALGALAMVWQEYLHATAVARRTGGVALSPSGRLAPHPAAMASAQALKQAVALLDRLGLSPAMRSKVAPLGGAAADGDELAEFLGGDG